VPSRFSLIFQDVDDQRFARNSIQMDDAMRPSLLLLDWVGPAARAVSLRVRPTLETMCTISHRQPSTSRLLRSWGEVMTQAEHRTFFPSLFLLLETSVKIRTPSGQRHLRLGPGQHQLKSCRFQADFGTSSDGCTARVGATLVCVWIPIHSIEPRITYHRGQQPRCRCKLLYVDARVIDSERGCAAMSQRLVSRAVLAFDSVPYFALISRFLQCKSAMRSVAVVRA
jgi:hypothetical protein